MMYPCFVLLADCANRIDVTKPRVSECRLPLAESERRCALSYHEKIARD